MRSAHIYGGAGLLLWFTVSYAVWKNLPRNPLHKFDMWIMMTPQIVPHMGLPNKKDLQNVEKNSVKNLQKATGISDAKLLLEYCIARQTSKMAADCVLEKHPDQQHVEEFLAEMATKGAEQYQHGSDSEAEDDMLQERRLDVTHDLRRTSHCVDPKDYPQVNCTSAKHYVEVEYTLRTIHILGRVAPWAPMLLWVVFYAVLYFWCRRGTWQWQESFDISERVRAESQEARMQPQGRMLLGRETANRHLEEVVLTSLAMALLQVVRFLFSVASGFSRAVDFGKPLHLGRLVNIFLSGLLLPACGFFGARSGSPKAMFFFCAGCFMAIAGQVVCVLMLLLLTLPHEATNLWRFLGIICVLPNIFLCAYGFSHGSEACRQLAESERLQSGGNAALGQEGKDDQEQPQQE